MKNLNKILFWMAVLAYSILFYEQKEGINYLIFSVLLIGLLAWANTGIWRRSAWCYVAGAYILTGFSLVWHHSTVAYFAHLLSFLLLCGLIIRPTASFYGSVLHFLGSTICSPFVKLGAFLNGTSESKTASKTHNPMSFNRLMTFALPVFITGLFFVLYQNGSPLFADLVSKIKFDFISWAWIFFTFTGFLLLFGTFFPEILEILNFDENKADQLKRKRLIRKKGDTFNFIGLKREFQTGKILLILLNSLLFLVNGLDFVYLFLLNKLPSGLEYKAFLHQSVNSQIFSIVLAIAVMLVYFRGNLNFYKKNTALKTLAYLWIFQNGLLVLITFYKNFTYIRDFGLTHKRIGVYVYLLLTFIGLTVTFYKVLSAKSNWFLFKTNAWLFYMVLIFSTFFNWDRIITDFNLQSRFKEKQFNWLTDYAIYDLSESNLPELTQRLSDPSTSVSSEQKQAIQHKKEHFLKDFKKTKSLSWNYEQERIYKEIK